MRIGIVIPADLLVTGSNYGIDGGLVKAM